MLNKLFLFKINLFRDIHKKKSEYLRRISRLANLVEMYETNIEQAKWDEEAQAKRLAKLHYEIDQNKGEESTKLVSLRLKDYQNFTEIKENLEEVKNERKKSTSKYDEKNDEFGETIPVIKTFELSKHEQSQLMAENKTLIERFSHTNSNILHIERQMSEIQKLQNTFAEKVF